MAKARILIAAIAVIAWFAVLLQSYLSLRLTTANGGSVGRAIGLFLGYFTVLTNVLVGVALTLRLPAPHSTSGRFLARPVGSRSAVRLAKRLCLNQELE